MKNILLLLSLLTGFSALAQQKSDFKLSSPLTPQQNIHILPLFSSSSNAFEKGIGDNVRLIQWSGNQSRSISLAAPSLTDYNKIQHQRRILMNDQIKMPYSFANKVILPLRFTPDNRQMSAGLEALLEASSLMLDLYIENNTQRRIINYRN
jgi:hypothetical protein